MSQLTDERIGFQLSNNCLCINGKTLLIDIPNSVSIAHDPLETGVFIQFIAPEAKDRHVFPIGGIDKLRRFTACHRYEPFWMKAAAGTKVGDVPIETQFLLVELEDGDCALFAPLVDAAFRASLQGNGDSGIELVVESGDPAVVTTGVTGLFVAVGPNPYALMRDGARSVMRHMGTGRLREEKPLPSFIDQFGWCTWDAFYQDVTHEKVREGLTSFAAGGLTPKYLILDDGWQSETTMPTGERRLTAFAANKKFSGDLTPTVEMAKGEFGIETFLVWHAMNGYWGGVDGDSLPGYGVRSTKRRYSPGILGYSPGIGDSWWGAVVGVVSNEDIYRFFQDYHRLLRSQGVDGVKVDNQCALEGLGHGQGGRVAIMRHYHEALEGSVHTHFRGALINCMSCSSEMLYGALNSNLTRTSTDFWPDKPESHGLHLYVNAQVSGWFGEFVHPDWDMFQSGHPMGAYHAAGRAVGGCPVYVSDKPGKHDFDLLRKLVLPDGSVLRASGPGRPTRDCLFHDPTSEDVLLKIFNLNLYGGVIAAFNARYRETGAETTSTNGTETNADVETVAKTRKETEASAITGSVSPADVEGLAGEHFAVYAHHGGDLRSLARDEKWEITLPQLTAEVFTIAPIDRGLAPIGLADLFNSAGAIVAQGWSDPNTFGIMLRARGRFLAWSERAPTRIEANGRSVTFTFDANSNRLEVHVPEQDSPELTIVF